MSKKQNIDVKRIETGLRNSFSKIREEMDVHLDSINENTQEINANFDYLMKLEGKVDKVSERIDDLFMILHELSGVENTSSKDEFKEQFEGIELSNREQEVFLALYTNTKDDFLAYSDIAKRTGLTTSLVEKYINSIVMKGVPIIKTYKDKTLMVSLDTEFKNLQAKENIISINKGVIEEF
ncbi:hypothetical protein GOV05_05180 [Candidatus Woesearchaeota archaeon]|nr:hypothetical protein [Candidatus Woesearchaeota archaeon]